MDPHTKKILETPELSWSAKAILLYISAHPGALAREIEAASRSHPVVVYAALAELQALQYIHVAGEEGGYEA